jgi:integrase
VGHIEDRWYKTVAKPGGGTQQVKSERYGTGMRYRVRYISPDGRERSESFPDRAKRAAEGFLASVESDKVRGTYIDPAAGRTPFAPFAEAWLRTHRLSESTRQSTEVRVRKHIIPFFGDRPISAIKPSTVREWDAGLIGKLSVGSRSTAFAHLSSILTAAVDDGLIASNPCSAKSVSKPRRVPRKVVPWRIDTVAAIRAALPPRYRPTVDIGAGCGARQGEIFGLSPDDIDADGGWLSIRRQVKQIRGRAVFGLPKNGKERQTPLPESVARSVKGYLADFPAVPVTLPWEDPFRGEPVTVPLLLTTARRNPIDPDTFNTWAWHPALVKVGITPSRTTGMHALRHFFASALLDGGECIKAIAEWLGHSDPAFTLRVYTHLMVSSQGRARQAIDELFDGPNGPDRPDGPDHSDSPEGPDGPGTAQSDG